MTRLARMLGAAVLALLRAILGRLLRGPAVPTWTWAVELRQAVLKAVFTATQEGEIGHETQRRIEARIDPPPPRSVRDVVDVRRGELAGMRADWIRIRDHVDLAERGTMLYLHGGGYVGGSPGTHRDLVSRMTWSARTRTVLVDYRLAPQHQFPAAVDDAVSAYRALLDDGVDPGSLFVAGDSAGGGLTAALLLRLRDEGAPQPAGAVLFSPYADLTHTSVTRTTNALTDWIPVGLGGANLEYVGDADPCHPWASPVFGDWHGIAPLLVFAGGVEILLDDAVRLVARARSAGVDVRFVVEPFMYHVWPAVVPEHHVSKRTFAQVADFVADRTTATFTADEALAAAG